MKKTEIILTILFLILIVLLTITLTNYQRKDTNIGSIINTTNSPLPDSKPFNSDPKSVDLDPVTSTTPLIATAEEQATAVINKNAEPPALDRLNEKNNTTSSIIFLHHSTGGVIWKAGVSSWLANYNTGHNTDYRISEINFPSANYSKGWSNYPYNYWDLWINPAKSLKDAKELTLEELSKNYELVVWKHCYPVSAILADTGSPNITSSVQTIENYKLQYAALKKKMLEFPNTYFLVWTGAALVEKATNPVAAARARDFSNWVKNSWDEPGDNIYVWDFRDLETEGGLYLLAANAVSASDSHPNSNFAAKVFPLFSQRLIDIIEGRGDK